MGKIKTGILIIILLLGFVLQNEIFFEEAWNFNTGYYLSSEIICDTMEERKILLENLYGEAEKHHVEVFSTYMAMADEFHYELQIYGNSTVRERIKQHGIYEGIYQSLLSGEMKVCYEDFMELQEESQRYITTVSFCGTDEDIEQLYFALQDNYNLTFPTLLGGNEKDVIYVLWSMIAMILVVMTCIEVLYNKKATIVQIAMGRSVYAIIFESILEDILVNYTIFMLAKKLVFSFIVGEFMKKEVFTLFSVGVIISCLCYFAYAFYDVRKAFSNVNDSRVILYITYFLKLIVTALSIVIIVTNISTIRKHITIKDEIHMVEQYGDYSYLILRDKKVSQDIDDETDRDEQMLRYNKEIYRCYEKNSVICTGLLEDSDRKQMYLVVNENAKDTLKRFVSDLSFDHTAEIVLFIPEYCNADEVKTCIGQYFYYAMNDMKNARIEEVSYTQNKTFTYIDNNAVYGMNTAENPIILFFQNMNAYGIGEGIGLEIDSKNIMYDLSSKDIKEMEVSFHLEKNGYEISKTSMADSYKYHKSVIKRCLYFCSSVCVFVLFMQFFLICIISKMEYRIYSMEFALKRVFGYSIWKKNARILYVSIGMYAGIVIVLSIIGIWMELYGISLCVMTGCFMLLLELCIVGWNIAVIEQRGISKTLKGGCL